MPSSIDDKLAFPNSDFDEEGMTLRDYFAARAMEALITCSRNHGDIPYALCAADAYRYADAMMEEREE
jgi:hypothetical protein